MNNELVSSRFDDPDFQLVWPRALFTRESANLLNKRDLPDWNDRCVLLLEQAFAGGAEGRLRSEFDEAVAADHDEQWNDRLSYPRSSTRPRGGISEASSPRLSSAQQFLRDLMREADKLIENGSHRRPYWRERRAAGGGAAVLDIEGVIRAFIRFVEEFDRDGYFDNRFGTDCIDDPRGDAAERLMRDELDADGLWPLTKEVLKDDPDLFFDIVELLHDHVSRPIKRSFHSYSGCGWHYGAYDTDSGRIAYRWRVNKILERSGLGLRFADEGEDVGRLVAATDDARMDLVQAVASRDDGPADQVRHALALFRERGADRNQKRSAVVSLALVLEERRRGVLTEALAKTDSGALFEIANRFHIRHQNADQARGYDDFYLDWIFWLYLASIELTNRIIDQQRRLQELDRLTHWESPRWAGSRRRPVSGGG